MKTLNRIAVLSLAIVLLASGAAIAATQPAIYGSVTDYVGTGKHPKSGVSGLIIDSKANGLKNICYNYMIFTSAKIQGQVSGTAERITDNGVEKLGTFSKMNVQKFDFGQPPPNDDACDRNVPDDLGDVNIGLAADCIQTSKTLNPGDIIRFSLKFKKGSKLQGSTAGVNLFGTVVPEGAFRAGPAETKRQARERAQRMTRDLVFGR